MSHKVESYTNSELIIRTDENKLVKLTLFNANEGNPVVYSEFLNSEWINYPAIDAEDLLNVNNPFGVQFEDKMTIDYFTCHYFKHWYENLVS